MPIIKQTKRMKPARMLVLGFLIIILAGALLLWLPFASREGQQTSFFDCLFTSTSATCVTGMNYCDTFERWSLFGQIVIALLVQIGGLGFVTIITFFNIAAGKKLGFRTIASAAEGLTENSFEGGRNIFVSIMKYSLIIELIGAVLLAIVFVPDHGVYGIWISIFTSITSFCNAGIDLFGVAQPNSSLMLYNEHPLVLLVIAVLVLIGGLGFIVWENFLNLRKVKKLSLHTKAVLIVSGVLVAVGTLFYLITEWNNPDTLGEMNFGCKLMNAFFTSVTTRSAGFTSIAADQMSEFSQLGTVLLMLIGAAPASTGGGIKVTTLLVMVMTVYSYIKNKNDVEIMGHKIDKLTVYRTLVVTVLSLFAVGVCFTALYFSLPEDAGEHIGALSCLFESVAAFSTAGLSVGVTSAAGTLGKLVLMLTMLIGRVGPISLVMSLVMNSTKRKNIVVPDGQIYIG